MKTRVYTYDYDTRKPHEARAYDEMCAELKATPGRGECMISHGGSSHFMPELAGTEVELETIFLFRNQWNTAPISTDGKAPQGRRLFDWAEDYQIHLSKAIKRGHYLDITDEMRAIREETLTCGYCGKYACREGYVGLAGLQFCAICLDSPYLRSEELHLLRMLPVATSFGALRAPLTEEEKKVLMPLYSDAQIYGVTTQGKARIAKQRRDIDLKFLKITQNANVERGGLLWLLDHGLGIENVIFYDHTSRFSFGWRTPVTGVIRENLLAALQEFPFDYDVV